MATIPPGRSPGPPGSKYAFVGPNFLRFAENGKPPVGYAYDPYRDKFFPDPNYQRQLEIDQGLRPPDPKSPGLAGTLGTVAGVAGVHAVGQQIGSSGADIVGNAISDGAATAAGTSSAASGAASSATSGAASGAASSGASGAVSGGVGGAARSGAGGASGASGAAAPPVEGAGAGSVVGPALSTAATLKGGYDIFKSQQNGGEGIRSATTTFGAGVGGFAGPVGAAVGAGMGNLAGYGLQDDGTKNNLALAANPITWPLLAARLAGVELFHKSTRQVQNEVTQKLIEEAGDDPIAQAYVMHARQGFDAPKPPRDPNAKGGGKYDSFEEYREAGLEAPDLTHVEGNIDAYSLQKWAALTEDQRIAVTQANIDSDIYYSKKGSVLIDDKEVALANFERVINGVTPQSPVQPTGLMATGETLGAKPLSPGLINPTPPPVARPTGLMAAGDTLGAVPLSPAVGANAQGAAAATGNKKVIDALFAQPTRTGTSPGFDENGNRINYGMIGVGR